MSARSAPADLSLIKRTANGLRMLAQHASELDPDQHAQLHEALTPFIDAAMALHGFERIELAELFGVPTRRDSFSAC